MIFAVWIERKTGCKLLGIHSDHGGEFDNVNFKNFCNHLGIKCKFSAPRTPQQNGVVERKNKTLIEVGRSILRGWLS